MHTHERIPVDGPLFDPSTYKTLPSPNDDLIGLSLYSPNLGVGWVGFDQQSEGTAFWKVFEGTKVRLLFDRILGYVDPMTGNLWMIFMLEEVVVLAGVIDHENSLAVHFHIPPAVRHILAVVG